MGEKMYLPIIACIHIFGRPKPVASKKTQELYAQNKGVQQRAQLDEEVDQEEEKNWDNAEAKLRVKTELYNNMGMSYKFSESNMKSTAVSLVNDVRRLLKK